MSELSPQESFTTLLESSMALLVSLSLIYWILFDVFIITKEVKKTAQRIKWSDCDVRLHLKKGLFRIKSNNISRFKNSDIYFKSEISNFQ